MVVIVWECKYSSWDSTYSLLILVISVVHLFSELLFFLLNNSNFGNYEKYNQTSLTKSHKVKEYMHT